MIGAGRRVLAGAAALCTLAVVPDGARAATIAVETTTDEAGNADGDCSLREAVRAADENSNAHEAGCTAGDGGGVTDTIQLGAATYALTLAGGNEEANLTGDLDLRSGTAGPVEIVGTGAGSTVIDASALGDRVLDLRATTKLDGLTITGASPPNNNDGGAALADGSPGGVALTLRLEDVAINDNFANGPGGDGGGIQITGAGSDDSLVVTDSVLSGNDAGLRGGAIDAFGGLDAITITRSALEGNTSVGEGGALRADTAGTTIEVENSSVTGGQADGGGGLHISNPGGTTDITRSVIAGNDSISGGDGGGVRVGVSDTTITDSVIRDNSATGIGVPQGGGLMATGSNSLTLVRTTVSGNDSAFEGGGVHAGVGTVDILNSTISGNSAAAAAAIDLESVGGGTSAAMVHATVAENTGIPSAGPPILAANGGSGLTLTVRESVFDETEAPACSATGGATIDSAGFNVDRGTSCTDAGDAQNTDAQLEALGAYGGTEAGSPDSLETVPTHALPASSSAVDEVPFADCTDDGTAPGTRDQRGFNRPFPSGGACDAGAYEVVEPCDGAGATILGTGAGETVAGSEGSDVISALGGNDTVNGLGGDDTICGGTGNDTVQGGAGSDSLDGGPGADTVTHSAGAAVRASLAEGTATGQGTDAISGFERLTGSAFADILAGNGLANVIEGLAGDDRITGLAGADAALGGSGRDLLKGRADNDLLKGQAGDDRLFGGGGAADRLFGSAGRDLHGGGAGRRDLCHGGGGRDRPNTKGCERIRRIP